MEQGKLPAIRYLNLNRKITALAAGSLSNEKSASDILFVGSASSLLAYDVNRNADVFFKDVQDGVNTLKIGSTNSGIKNPLLFVGGNCSIVGFDRSGSEEFWTVTGDNVSSIEVTLTLT